jgi:hypothetical protein
MRFMMIMHPGPKAYAPGALPDEKGIAAMMKYNEELQKAGVLLALDGLQGPDKGARVRFTGGKPTVFDGPFTEAKELVGGYWMLQVKSKAEAIEWAKRCPANEDDMIEVRQVFEASDFDISPELEGRVDALGKQLAQQK